MDLKANETRTYRSVADYVRAKGGKRVINRVLIANNGIAAVKAIRSMKKWSYENFGSDKVIQFIVMATPEDIKVNAEYIRLGDECVNVPGGSNNCNYANVMLITEIAENTGADAVWAGWGHASEDPRLPDALGETKSGVVWIGPPSGAMRALGDKIGSSLIAQSAGVPCMGWSGSGITVNYSESGISEDVYMRACVKNAAQCRETALRVGYPIMIKASEGGGGKGIRKAMSESDNIEMLFSQVQGEVPGSPIFLMKLSPVCRHLEVQLLADEWGEAIAIFGRDCSIQRRHQKIIEEGPVVAAPPETWRHMEQSAVALAKEVGYVGAGTVEYLYTPDNKYYFLELNPRLQVEHPVTELISGVNLPAAQLQVAMGIPLHAIAGVRRMYGEHPNGISPIDFSTRVATPLPGHVIACRITAENPDMGFQPTSGVIQELNFRSTPAVWGYFSISSNGGVHEYSDSQFGHLFAMGETRAVARQNMSSALRELSIRGDIRTTVEYLRTILETHDFKRNLVNTTWLEKVMRKSDVVTEKPDVHISVLLGALYRAYQKSSSYLNDYMSALQRGALPSKSLYSNLLRSDLSLIYDDVKYSFKVTKSGPDTFDISLDDTDWTVSSRVVVLADDGLLVFMGGKKYVIYGQEFPAGLRLTVNGQTVLFKEEYDPTRILSTMQGKLVRWMVEEGSKVAKDEPVAEVEVMKMYLTLTAPEAGIITPIKPPGSILEAGDLLADLELDFPDTVRKADEFKGTFPNLGEPSHLGNKASSRLRNSLSKVNMLLNGYQLGTGAAQESLTQVLHCLRSPQLPLDQFKEIFSTITSRIPEGLFAAIKGIIGEYDKATSKHRFYWEPSEDFPVAAVQNAIDHQYLKQTPEEQSTLTTTLTTAGLIAHLQNFKGGNHNYAVHVLSALLEEYHKVEAYFSNSSSLSADEVLKQLRHTVPVDEVALIARSNHQLQNRTQLVAMILDSVRTNLEPLIPLFVPILRKLSTLVGRSEYAEIVLKCRQLITRHNMPSFADRRIAVLTLLQSASTTSQEADRAACLSAVTDHKEPIDDLIFAFLKDSKVNIRITALEAYVRRVYHAYTISKLSTSSADDNKASTQISCNWEFFLETPSKPTLVAPDLSYTRRIVSLADLSQLGSEPGTPKLAAARRSGLMAYFRDLDTLKTGLRALILSQDWQAQVSPVNVVYFAVVWGPRLPNKDDQLQTYLRDILKIHTAVLKSKGVRRVTFVVTSSADNANSPLFFTYRATANNYTEDSSERHIEPSYAVHMQLSRLSNFNLQFTPTSNRTVHLFEAVPKEYKSNPRDRYDGRRFFSRVLIRKLDSAEIIKKNVINFGAYPEMEIVFVEALNSLEMSVAGNFKAWRFNHIFINVLSVGRGPTQAFVEAFIRNLAKRYSSKIRRLNVSTLEFAIALRTDDGEIQNYRIFGQAPTREVLAVDTYLVDSSSGVDTLVYVGDRPDEIRFPDLEGTPVNAPYPISEPLRMQREKAWATGTAYCYDFLPILRNAIRKRWYRNWKQENESDEKVSERPADLIPGQHFQATELIIGPDGTLVTTQRPVGQNDIGMVAWHIQYKSIEYPEGRDIVIIANDISVQFGTFGVLEDKLYDLASKYARARGIPRIYLAANSGARIGLAEELRSKFKVAWTNDDVTKGMAYLYLNEADQKEMKQYVITQRKEVGSEVRYVLTDIIGKSEGLGVENLSGSGLIAGETSLAYDQVFTLTVITSRSVGIGAYLARLGQRVIQKKAPPILLTGFNALNKLLGRKVYRSNTQLGGIDIMYSNGVSHMVCDNDMQGMLQMLTLLSYVPKARGSGLPIRTQLSDPISRPVAFDPSKETAYDARWMLAGRTVQDQWQSGFFDKNSFTEVLGGWAKSVVAGRARLGGIPIGVIAVEPRLTELVRPADPANPDSKEEVKPKAPLVWFPDSAYKTAQAIFDLKAEELPLMIFANWRGFSGGMADMFDEVLKFGSMIVDALRQYDQPVFVYLPPNATLRGGAWVVVDSKVNQQCIEMYAAPSARGGVLETEGTADVKFKGKHLKKTMHRLDTTLQELDAKLKAEAKKDDKTTAVALKKQIAKREEALLPYYHTVATHFCDLHDTPGRMKAKEVIREIVPFETSREYFYWRLRYRLTEQALVKNLQTCQTGSVILRGTPQIDSDSKWLEARALIQTWMAEAKVQGGSDQAAVEWIASNSDFLNERLEKLRRGRVQELAQSTDFLDEMAQLIARMNPEQQAALQAAVAKSL